MSSQYVKRCTDCRKVRGVSAFAIKTGGRLDVCHWCTERRRERQRLTGQAARDLKALKRLEVQLANKLAACRSEIRLIEGERHDQQRSA